MPSKKKHHKGKLTADVHKGVSQKQGGSFWLKRNRKRPSVAADELDLMPGLPSPSMSKNGRVIFLRFVHQQVMFRKQIEDEELRERKQQIRQRISIGEYLEAIVLLKPISMELITIPSVNTKMRWEYVRSCTIFHTALQSAEEQERDVRRQIAVLESRCRRSFRHWSHISYRDLINPKQISHMFRRERFSRAKLSAALMTEFQNTLEAIDLLRWECIDEDRRKAGEKLRETVQRYNNNNRCWNPDASFLGIRPVL